jgi:hypothetical protein
VDREPQGTPSPLEPRNYIRTRAVEAYKPEGANGRARVLDSSEHGLQRLIDYFLSVIDYRMIIYDFTNEEIDL